MNLGGYDGVDSLSRASPGIKKAIIQKWLEGQDTYTGPLQTLHPFHKGGLMVEGLCLYL